MKKVLILGGSRYILPVIEACHKLGCKAITCDYLPDNIAHKYSDEYYNVSIIDKNKVLELAKTLKIDGITSFACDPGVVTAAYVAEKMQLPHVASYETVSLLQNKALFRQFLSEHDFNVPKAKGYSSVSDAIAEADEYKWPVIVKPVDSAGSKGVTRIDAPELLIPASEYALRFSKAGKFIVEEFIQQQGFSSDTDCFSVNGRLVYCSFNCQLFDKNASNPYTPAAYSWPSNMPDSVQTELRSELQRLITLLGLQTSIYNIETRQGIDGRAYIMEVSPRGGGNRLAELLRYASGTDLITNSVRAAIGENIAGIDGDPIYNGYWAIIILHADECGIYDRLWIDDSIQNCVIEYDLWVKEGENVYDFASANHAIGTLVLRFDTKEQLETVMSDIPEYIKVLIKK